MRRAPGLDATQIAEVIALLTDDRTIGVLLTGSYARNEATLHSDIDVFKFVNSLPADTPDHHQVRLFRNKLLSISLTTVGRKFDELKRPETAIWVVPGIRQAVILSDTDGAISGLRDAADRFEWSRLQADADAYAEREFAGLAEEVNKLLGTIDAGSEMTYATLGLALGLTKAVAVKLGVLIQTEDRYLDLVEEAVGTDSEWASLHKAAYGRDGASSLRNRSVAALRLYRETYRLLGPPSGGYDAQVINSTITKIENFISNCPNQ